MINNNLNNQLLEEYINAYQEKCMSRSCYDLITKEDLLQNNVHITSCKHIFHEYCLKVFFNEHRDRWNTCSVCNTSIDYLYETEILIENFKINKLKILKVLGTHKQIKRSMKKENDIDEPQLKKQKLSQENVLVPQLPLEIWEIIGLNLLNVASSKDFCLSLKKIISLRAVSSEWSSFLNPHSISKTLKIYLDTLNIKLQEMYSQNAGNPLTMACYNKETELAQILLNSSNDATLLLDDMDYKNETALHISIAKKDLKTFEVIVEFAVAKNIEIILVEGDDVADDVDTIIGRILQMDNQNCKVFLEKLITLNNNNIDLVEEVVFTASRIKNFEILEWLCYNTLIHLPFKESFWYSLCMMAIESKQIHLLKKIFECLGHKVMNVLLNDEENNPNGLRQSTLLHHAVFYRGNLDSVKVIIEAAGPRALELLEIRIHADEYGTEFDLTPLELALTFENQDIVNYFEQKKNELIQLLKTRV